MTRAELLELEHSVEGGFSDTMKRMIETDPEGKVNGAVIMAEMKKLILGAYGVKSADGKNFIKNDQLRESFLSSEAYSVLFMSLVTDAEAATEFINGIIPKDLSDETQKALAQNGVEPKQTPMGGVVPESERVQPRKITRAELMEMPTSEWQEAVRAGTLEIVD
jgi:hypothetical protein